MVDKYRGKIPGQRDVGLTEHDALLITYPDQVQEPRRPTLVSLAEFCEEYLDGIVSGIHILPFYPWSSDDGFSVIDYEAVAGQYGQWDDVRRLGERFRLMFDAVINHASAESPWFKGFLRAEPAYRDYFIAVRGNPDLSGVVRPRALPLLTRFRASDDEKQLWTTFSADQVDLNYQNPNVLMKVMELLLFYASQGADFLRLDAIAYIWKEIGTPCINLPQVHWIVQLMRAVLDEVAPHVMLITETNVPNLENLSYFGDGSNEAQLIYNFPLPPLVLHALQTGNANVLSQWASTLRLPSSRVTFLNFLASHDGIGLNPVRGILPDSEIEALARGIEARGGLVSHKTNVDGTQSPYELNINYFDALGGPSPAEDEAVRVRRFVTAHAILLAFRGVPAIYFHSLIGSRGWPAGVMQSGSNRSINREKLQRSALQRELADASSMRAQVFKGLSRLLKIRAGNPCFSPDASQRILDCPSGVFALMRQAAGTDRSTLCIHNVSPERQALKLDVSGTSLAAPKVQELLSGRKMQGGRNLSLDLEPYESAWITN